ncbi:formylglycine-generating enzyme family protein [Breznakiellaceae bacterium SP9]
MKRLLVLAAFSSLIMGCAGTGTPPSQECIAPAVPQEAEKQGLAILQHIVQRTGETDQGTTKRLSIGENPSYVLSINVRNRGTKNMFTAAILNVADSSQGETGRADYESIVDGIALMAEPAGKPAEPVCTAAAVVPANMVLVPAGTFAMGSTNGYDREKPVHQVTISKPFYISKYAITQKEWTAVMGSNPSNWKGDNLPVENVSWFEAVEYCNKRSQKEGLTPAYSGSGDYITCNFNANGYRLPTEAEWEWAAKGGGKDGLVYEYAGGNDVNSVGWYYANSGGRTHEVGTKAPNSLGIYDMSGNVWEWCWDWYGGYSSAAQTDPVGAASGSDRVYRGGSWYFSAAYLRSADRGYGAPTGRGNDVGFRVVRP